MFERIYHVIFFLHHSIEKTMRKTHIQFRNGSELFWSFCNKMLYIDTKCHHKNKCCTMSNSFNSRFIRNYFVCKNRRKKMFEIKKSGQKFKLMDFSIYYILIVDGLIWNFKNHDSSVKPWEKNVKYRFRLKKCVKKF